MHAGSEDYRQGVSEISRILKEATASRGRAALGFSGGLDSTTLLAASGLALVPYTVGLEGSKDLDNSETAASMLGIAVNRIVLSEDQVLKYRDVVRTIDPQIQPQDAGYEIVLAALLDSAPEKDIFTGQGADELFYGYRRFYDDPSLDNSGHIRKLFSKTLPREKKIAKYFGKNLVAPYLDSRIVEIAGSMGKEVHMDVERNKIVLRGVAASLGIPPDLAERKKKAAQYGSGTSKVLRKHTWDY